MRVATWNVNGLRSRLEFVKIWLRERKPDAVALQELKLEDDQFPHEELQAEGYFAAVHGQKAWNGVAVLARERPELVQKGATGRGRGRVAAAFSQGRSARDHQRLLPEWQERPARGLWAENWRGSTRWPSFSQRTRRLRGWR